MHIDEYRDAYDPPSPARVPRLGRREPGQAPEVTPEAAGPPAGHTAPDPYASEHDCWVTTAPRYVRPGPWTDALTVASLRQRIAHHRREAARLEAELLIITRQETDE